MNGSWPSSPRHVEAAMPAQLREHELLVQLLALQGTSPTCVSREDWRALAACAGRANVIPALYSAVRGRSDVPPDVMDMLSTAHHQALTSNVILLAELDRILAALTAQAVPVILLKGASFLRHHGWDIGLRSMADLDLLIRRADLDRAGQALAEIGFVQEPGDLAPGFSEAFLGECSFAKSHPRFCRLDLHHRLYVFGRARLENDAVWDRSVPARGAPETVRALSTEDEIHYLAFHLAFHHKGEGLKWLVDLARLVSQHQHSLAWDALLDTADRCRTGLALRAALEGSAALGAPVPSSVLHSIAHYRPTFGERLFLTLIGDDRFTWHARTLAVLPSIPGLPRKATYLHAKLFPSPEYAGKAYSADGRYSPGSTALRMLSLALNCLRGVALVGRALLAPHRDTKGHPSTRKR